MATILAAVTNPLVRRALPLIGDLADAFGINDSTDAGDDIISHLQKVVPVIRKMRSMKISEASSRQLSELLSSAGVKMDAADVDLWLHEIQSFAADGDQNFRDFMFGPSGRKMFNDILGRGREPSTRRLAKPVEEIPLFDPVTGLFVFK